MSQPRKNKGSASHKNKKDSAKGNGYPWINPIGGYGDMLIVGGVLKQVHERDPKLKFNLLRRTRYVSIFEGHPAIAEIGHPSQDDVILDTTYWSMETLGGGEQRAYQVLARYFDLPTPIEEVLYLAGVSEEDPLLDEFVPWKDTNIIIAPASDSPRKSMHPGVWHQLVDRFLADGAFVAQVGLLNELQIKNAYALRGQTDPRQLVRLLKKMDLVVTADNFIMHAAHMVGTPAVVTWGPTQSEVYGYPEQEHLQRHPNCELKPGESCLASDKNEGGHVYGTPCPLEAGHCMAQITPDEIYKACRKMLARTGSRARG